jgi:hypothetical protein
MGRLVVAFAIAMLSGCASIAERANTPYFATVDVRRGPSPAAVQGVVFDDANHNGRYDDDEHGLRDVKVSNGRDVTLSDSSGRYRLPIRADMSVFVIQPSGWRVPTDAHWIPQFAYEHKPAGSPKKLRYGGLPPTGPLPSAINFPLVPDARRERFNCAVMGDVQVYSGDEIGYARDSVVRDLLNRGAGNTDCVLALGDLVGDDLGLIPRIAEVLGAIGAPQWWVHCNHDYDHDADSDSDSADTWRHSYGPADYAFEIGRVSFIVIDNVSYPCGGDEREARERPFCKQYYKTYNGRISPTQLTFIANVLKATDPNRLVVFATHIPLVGFDNRESQPHQTDDLQELYALLEGRRALSLSGHSHTLENLAPGDSFAGWQQAVGVSSIPFRHLVAGAVAGDWWGGDYDIDGVPMSLQGDGSPRGFVDFAVNGVDYTLDYRATGLSTERAMWLSVNTPAFRSWARQLWTWVEESPDTRSPIPPLSVHDLPDEKLLTRADLAGTTWLTANIWMGDSTTSAMISIDGGTPVAMSRTQQAHGEPGFVGAEYADPFALQRQLTVARSAIESSSGTPETQGYIQGRQPPIPPSPPQPRGSRADHSSHLWRYQIPADLPEGVHTATVTVTRAQGAPAQDTLVFEVRHDRPPRTFRRDHWEATFPTASGGT